MIERWGRERFMKDRCRSAIAFAVATAGVGLAARPTAFAQDSVPSASNGSDEAAVAALLAQGTELRRARRDEEALHVFERAQAQRPSPEALAQVALAEQATGRWVGAERDLVQALASADDPWIAKHRAELTSALAYIRNHLGQLEILGSPAGATVLLNGARVGTLPLPAPLTVANGEAVVGLAAGGYTPLSRKVTIEAGRLAREVIDLPALAPAVATAPNPSTLPLIDGAPRPSSQADAVDDSRWTWRRRAAIGAAGVGVVGLGLGIGFGLSSMSKHDDAAKICPGACTDQHGVDLWNQARSAGNVSTAAFIVAAAGLAGGAALWFIVPSSAPASPTQIGLGPGTLQMKGTW
jgi:hypothetical protein